ncbi:MAG: hypothetical protein Q8O89_02845 [Nanoarchaeota archaeon]|nr:hypothetical protein [Nanoarchaeota archaeon]
MKNRTKVIKLIEENLKTINPDDYPDIKEELLALSEGIKRANQFLETIRGIKALIPETLQELNIKTDEGFRKELNYGKIEVDELLGNEDEDFDKLLAFDLALQKYTLNKAGLFSKERKEISLVVKRSEDLIKSKDELFELIINKMMPAINQHINLIQLKKGNISALKEITSVPILLDKNEKCYIKVDGVELYEDVAVRDTIGGISGFSFRITKGVSYRIGGFKAKGESHMGKRLIDKGTFYVTNKRYIYDGSAKNIDSELGDIISVEAYSDGIKISRANKRDEVYAGNANWEYVGTIISGIVKNVK